MGILSFLFGKPNIDKLKEKCDVLTLGKLLKNKRTDIRTESAKALAELLFKQCPRMDYFEYENLASQIIRQFTGLNNNEIADTLIKFLGEKLEQGDTGYGKEVGWVCRAVLDNGGLDQLIDLHKRASSFSKIHAQYREYEHKRANFHNAISIMLIAYAAAFHLGIEKLLEIIPWAMLQYDYEGKCEKIREILEKSEPVLLSKERLEEIKRANKNIPDYYMGLSNYAKERLMDMLLKKVRTSDDE